MYLIFAYFFSFFVIQTCAIGLPLPFNSYNKYMSLTEGSQFDVKIKPPVFQAVKDIVILLKSRKFLLMTFFMII
jgi:hypothetical protein